MRIIKRRELEEVLRAKWLLLYGRRKTGKTFYVRERGEYSAYFVVTRGKSVVNVDTGEEIPAREFSRLFPYLLQEGGVVIDEFHRLDEPFFSLLQGLSGRGKLTLITSTRHYFKRLIGSGSPLLGLFHLQEVGLVDPRDAIVYVHGLGYKGKTLMELSCILQEPWLAPYIETFGKDTFGKIGYVLRDYIPSLVGEIFTEEERELSKRYFAILEAVADGKRTSGEIASELFSRGLVEKDSPGNVSPYLETLVGMGILERIPFKGGRGKGYHYRHVSPLMDFAFYLNSKYGFFETGLPEKQIASLLEEKLPKYMEVFFEKLLAREHGLQPLRIELPDLEVDVALRRHKKLHLVAEVKWKRKITKKDIKNTEDKLSRLDAPEKLLIVPDKSKIPIEPDEIRVVDWKYFLKLSAGE